MSDYVDPYADEMPDRDDPIDDGRWAAEPPDSQADIDAAMFDEDRDAMIDAIGNGVSEQDEACVQAARALAGDSNDAEHDALVAMLDAFGPGQVQLGGIVETKIPEWERAGYDKLVEMVNGPELEDEIEYCDDRDDCRIINGERIQCPKCKAYEAEMYRQFLAGALDPEAEDEDPDALPERDVDFELKYERENSR